MACEKNEKKSQVIDIALFSCALFCLHLLRFMIESIYKMIKEQQIMYDFDEQTLSDLHKDARGFRPRGEFFWSNWTAADADGKQAIWDGLIRELDQVQAEEAQRAAHADEGPEGERAAEGHEIEDAERGSQPRHL